MNTAATLEQTTPLLVKICDDLTILNNQVVEITARLNMQADRLFGAVPACTESVTKNQEPYSTVEHLQLTIGRLRDTIYELETATDRNMGIA